MRQRVGMSRRDDLDIVVVCCCCCGLATLHWCYQLRRRIDDFDLVIMVDNGSPSFLPYCSFERLSQKLFLPPALS
jgi:hypothetical protein